MAERLIPGVGVWTEPETAGEYLVPGVGIVSEEVVAAEEVAVMNQLQGSNLGADLFNGTLQ